MWSKEINKPKKLIINREKYTNFVEIRKRQIDN